MRLSGFAGGDILFRPGIPHSSIATDVLRQVTHDHFVSQRNHGVRIMERKLALRKAAALYGGHLRQDGANTPVVSLAGGQEPHRVSSGALSGKSGMGVDEICHTASVRGTPTGFKISMTSLTVAACLAESGATCATPVLNSSIDSFARFRAGSEVAARSRRRKPFR